jgi:O-antigen/teichoic acid export membrane protein
MTRSFADMDDRTIFRSLTAAGLGVSSKIVGLINQIVSVTLITTALGAEGLREQMLAIAFVSWFNLTLCGMHTSLPVLLIRSGATTEASLALVKTAYILAALGALLSLVLTVLLLCLVSGSDLPSAPVIAAAICNAAVLVFSLSEKVFHATDRIGQFHVLNIIGTATSLAATFLLARMHPTAVGFVLTFYAGILLPFIAATIFVAPHFNLKTIPSAREFRACARQLVGTGAFGLGYELASYCKLQAPLALLGVIGISSAIAPVGLGLRLLNLIGGGLTIVIPILMLRMGAAEHAGDKHLQRLWSRMGFILAAMAAIGVLGLYHFFGERIFETWTGGTVLIEQPVRMALAVFSAIVVFQSVLFPLVAVNATLANRLRWLFWLEGPAVVAASAAGALAVPSTYGGAGMLVGASLVMAAVTLVLLLLLARKHSDR